MKPDPAIEEIRAIRKEISKECGHDPKLLVSRYRDLEKRFGNRLLKGRSTGEAASATESG